MSEKQQVLTSDRDLDDRPEPATDGLDHKPDSVAEQVDRPREIGGRKGPDPTRYGDWEKNGRCIDF